MDNIAIILAGGVGSRFDNNLPKQFYIINNKPVLYWTVLNFQKSNLFDKIVVVVPQDYIDKTQKTLDNVEICLGGNSRQESLYNAVSKTDNSKIVSHCACRPIVSKKIIEKNLQMIKKNNCVDTVRYVYDTMIYDNKFIEREKVYIGLTPQSFYSDNYINAYQNSFNPQNYSCACSLMNSFGYDLELLKTNELIYKITTKEDLSIIEKMLPYD